MPEAKLALLVRLSMKISKLWAASRATIVAAGQMGCAVEIHIKSGHTQLPIFRPTGYRLALALPQLPVGIDLCLCGLGALFGTFVRGIFVNNNRDYWKANLRHLLGILLSIWFIVSFGFGILLVDQLNQIPFFGFKAAFGGHLKGSIYVFVILIFAYIYLMQKPDRKFGVSDEDDHAAGEDAATIRRRA